MNCPNCQFDNPATARFCQNCGQALAQPCPTCGTVNAPAAKFCMECGTRLPDAPLPPQEPAGPGPRSSGERRVVTILFCDVKGSTTLAEQLDPEMWTEVMDGAFEYLVAAVRRYDGTVARLMGDAILAIFGAPVTHEDDPIRAIRAGLDMIHDLRPYQEQVRERLLATGADVSPSDFEVRVGINTGLVVVGEVGSAGGHEYTAMGDAVNLAARMEQAAQPGTVLIAHDTYKLVAPLIEIEALGGLAVKGKREPVKSYRVLALQAQPGLLRGLAGREAPLIGRKREMTQLEWALSDLGQKKGRIVCLMGEAGLGKSRLIAECRRHELSQGCRWFEVASLSFEQDQPYGLIRRLIRQQAGAAAGDDSQTLGEKLDLLLNAALEGRQEEFRRAVQALFGLDAGPDQAALEGEALVTTLAAGLGASWRAGASSQPLILVFEDLHWTDQASVDLIGRLLPLAAEAPILFLCAFRPDRDQPVWQLKQQAESELAQLTSTLSLQPLSDQESGVLASSLMTVADLPQALREMIWHKAAGIPFFVEEIVREMVESGLVVPDEAAGWVVAGEVDEIAVPENLEALLVARIDRLEEPVRRTLQLAAVIGWHFHHQVLALISGDRIELARHLQTLQEADLIRRATANPESAYIFRHVLTQEAAYNTILLKDRRRYHQQTGEIMAELFSGELAEQAPLLAYHFAEAGDKRQALKFYSLAADNAALLYANNEALQHYGRALEVAGQAGTDDTTPTALLHGRGEIYERLGDFDRAQVDFDRSLTLARSAGDRRAEWQALLDLGKLWASRDYDQAGDYFRQSLDIARQLEEPILLAKSLNRVGNYYVNVAQPAQGIAFHREALALFEALDDRAGLAATQDLLGMANLIAGDMVAAGDHYRSAVELFEALGDDQGKVASQSILFQAPGSYLLYTLVTQGDFESSEALGTEALALARRIGWQPGEAFILEVFGSRNGLRGSFDQALEPAREALRLASEIGHHQWMTGAHVALGNVYQAMLALKDAREHMALALELARATRSEFWRNNAVGFLAQILLETGEPERAQAYLEGVLGSEIVTDNVGQRLCWLARAELALAQDEPELAVSIVEHLIASAANIAPGVVISILWLVHGEALRAAGRLVAAESVFREGLEHARVRGEGSLCWRFQASLTRLYWATNRPERAREAASQGLALVEQLAATIPDDSLRDNFLIQAQKRFEAG